MFASRYFRRLFVPYLLLIFVATAAVGVFAAVRLREAYLNRTRESLAGEANLAIVQLGEMLGPRNSQAPGAWRRATGHGPWMPHYRD